MARGLDRIERDIAELERGVAALAEEFQTAYSKYLEALAQGLRQQLVLAAYYLCTQTYPEGFLKLSFKQRQKLQQELRQVAVSARELLLSPLASPPASTGEASEVAVPRIGLPSEMETSSSISTPAFNPLNPLPVPNPESSPLEFPSVSASDIDLGAGLNSGLASETVASNLSSNQEEVKERLTNPMLLAQWQQSLEHSISKTLQVTSGKANRLLQSRGILPKKMPEQILEAAAKAEMSDSPGVASPPNLLNLLIETGEGNEESLEERLTQLQTIHLRLSEIEFADANVMGLRNQIRQLINRLAKLGREYQKKQREKAIAEAEAAWRSSWFDE